MPEWMEKGKELNDLIRPHTFPLAIKLVKREEEIPQGARRPWRDLKVKIAICQGITLSRRYGWTVAMTEADTGCAFARVIYGWEADGTKMSDFLVKMGYAATHEAGVKIGKG